MDKSPIIDGVVKWISGNYYGLTGNFPDGVVSKTRPLCMCDGQIVKKNFWKILVGIGECIIFGL